MLALASIWILTWPSEDRVVKQALRESDLLSKWVKCFPTDHAYCSYRFNPDYSPELVLVSSSHDRMLIIVHCDIEMTFWRRGIRSVGNTTANLMPIESVSWGGGTLAVAYRQEGASLSSKEIAELVQDGNVLRYVPDLLTFPPIERLQEVVDRH